MSIKYHLEFLGADLVSNDGIYSAYFTQFNANGRYSIQAQVRAAQQKSFINFNYVIGVGDLRSSGQYVVNGSESAENDNSNFENIRLSEFTRVTSGSLIEVSGYIPGIIYIRILIHIIKLYLWHSHK